MIHFSLESKLSLLSEEGQELYTCSDDNVVGFILGHCRFHDGSSPLAGDFSTLDTTVGGRLECMYEIIQS